MSDSKEQISIEEFERKHVEEVSEIHMSSWAEYEISVILGKRYVSLFYQAIVDSPSAFGYVCSVGGKIAAYATGFWDYEKFSSDLLRSNKLLLIRIFVLKILFGRLGLQDVYEIYLDGKTYKNLRYSKYHQNGLALRNEFKHTFTGLNAILGAVEKVIETFRSANVPGCWGRIDHKNIVMQKYYKLLGFNEVEKFSNNRSRYIIFEKTF